MKDDSQADGAPRAEFLTARQLAAVLQVSESTVRRLAREGRIPAVRLTPHLVRFHLPSVIDALDGSQRRPRQQRRAPDDDNADASPQLSFTDLF